jgi:pimeloyl-ACP methyl ester carboxylesterase
MIVCILLFYTNTFMKPTWLVLAGLLPWSASIAQYARKYTPVIQTCGCAFKVDSSFITTAPPMFQSRSTFEYKVDSSFQTQCGYLIVPENRKKAASRMIKLPFIVLKSKNPNKKKDPVLFTSGGPGNSSLSWINGMTKSSIIRDRDAIAFEQRGTRFAIPYLRLFELDSALKESYRNNLPKDSMWMVGVKRYKKKLERKGIDLAGYNSDETVADIRDLLTVLHIDSVNLMGGSYSGGLMMAVLQKEPARVRSLVLDSPLPMFVPIDEDEPMNFNEALKVLAGHVAKDSANQELYNHLYERFQQYFTAITHQVFYLPYVDKNGDTLRIQYTKNELLDAIENGMLNQAIKDVPYMITEIIKGNHIPFIQPRIARILNGYSAPDGMRMTVYCADQANYHSQQIVQQLYKLYPYMDGYHINDVWKTVCNCWDVPPVNPVTKQPFYSSKPVLIGDGDMDPACRPLYMRLINHYMPNGQCFLFINRGHGVGGKDWFDMTQQFLDNPYGKVEVKNGHIIPY